MAVFSPMACKGPSATVGCSSGLREILFTEIGLRERRDVVCSRRGDSGTARTQKVDRIDCEANLYYP
jgi:hypothetical protein